MAYEQHRDVSIVDEALDPALALLLEEHVAHGERLVHDEDIGLSDGRDGEGDARDHARGKVLHGHVDEVRQLCKVDDFLEVLIDELLGVSEQRAVEVNVLARGELQVKARAELDERRDVAPHDAFALARLENARDDFKHGGFAGAVRSHQAHDFAGLHLKGDVLERAELVEEQLVFHELNEVLFEAVELLGCHIENHRYVVDLDGVFRRVVGSHGDPLGSYG